MFSTRCFLVIIFHCVFYRVLGEQPYGPHPRIVSDNGNLIIYAADHKNVTLRTTGHGYINLNDENLVLIIKDAQNAAETVKRIKTNVINPFSSSMNRINDIIDGPDGLLKRISYLEGQNSTIRLPTRNTSIIGPYRARQFGAILRRVRALELKMASMYTLLVTNECNSNPCKNGGGCIDIYNGYLCKCPDAWTGPTCETDVNECGKFSGTDLGCQNGATCVNKQGSYECICVSGWFGIHCNRRTQDCNSGPPQELCGHGICVSQNTGIGYKCICDQGWKTDGNSPACNVDVNECESAKPHCSVNPLVPCINVPGTFYCGSCPQGYTGNGYYCSDIDECLIFNGGCSMNPRVQCINTMGSRMCGSCPPGYFGDGITCSYRGVCQVNNGGCHQLARCVDNPNINDNYVQCICPNGYAGSGIGPLGCTRTEISPYISSCSSNPCVHGLCTSHSNNSFICICQNGYSGVTCNIKATSCDSNPCLNGGTCTNTATGFICECTSNFTGSNCDTEREVCGGMLANEVGFLQYPTSNNSNYNHQVSCSWVIKTLPDKVLNITFTKFHVEHSETCQFDWLQIHDGPNSAAHVIGRFCGNEFPKGGVITSTRNTIYIWFRSDNTISNPGFALKWNSIEPVCGRTIILGSHDVIKSPGFPGNYPPDRDCTWQIDAPFGKRIQLHFFSLMIGNNANCSSDYLEIRSGSTVLIKFCNSSNPEPFISTGSSLTIYFHSDEFVTDKGFQISLSLTEGIPGCGGTFTSNRGEITSPAHDEQYPANLDCEYKIKMNTNFRIKIIFLSFALEESMRCRFDFLEIREGARIDSPLVGRYCGSNIPPSYSSIGNELYIRFKTDAYINDGGFRIKYDSVCGNVFDTPTGKIIPSESESPKTCTYEIKQQPQKAIKLRFRKVDTSFRFSECTLNYIEVRDGDNQNSPLIGKYCGFEVPTEIISTHNYLWIRLESQIRMTKEFEAEYSTIDLQCGGILKESNGIVRSPASPNKYPPNTKCTWLLNAPPGFSIQINWINFNLEYAINCDVVDYVALYENNTDTGNSSLMGKYCGKKLPPIMTSTTNVVTVVFKSDVSLNADGFTLIYSFLDDSKVCGGNYFVPTGEIQTPNYPEDYFPNKECVWVISVPHGQQIMLHVEDFELEQYLNCRSDYLEIRNGAFESSPIIGTYCGKSIPKQIPSHTNNLFLKFHSDNAVNKKGFKIIWDGTTTGCGGTLTSPTGQIASPNYPQTYGANAMCFWKISTSAGSTLNLIFLDLNLEEHLLCRLDYVELYDGLDVQSKSFGRFCSDAGLHSISTSSNKALVKFRSDISQELRGFLLKYTTVCNITLTGYRGVIESLNFPNNYPKNQNCLWTINVPMGNKINISFSHFELESSLTSIHDKTCKFDYLEIVETDDYESKHTILNKTCGNELPSPIQTAKNRAEIHFVSDSMVHAPGFRLEWLVDGCTAILTHPTGEISTPGYPYGYPHETECHWKIQVEFNSSVMLNISEFGFEKSVDCMYDSLQVFNGPDESAPLLSKICHNDEKALSLVSTSNVMFVKFTSDTSYAGKGFKATYKTVPNQCGGKYTAPQGSIHSRNYPKNYKTKDDCEWLIELHQNFVVELNFEELDLVFSPNCSNDYLKIYDGNNDQAPLLHTLCGNNKPNETIRSLTNTLYLRMSTKSRNTAKGFLANYTTGCGMRKIVSSNGILDFADWGHWECTWTLYADSPEKHISLTITHMELNKDCDTPTLKIFDGPSDEAPLLGGYCGNKVPPMLVTKGSAMHIVLENVNVGYISATYSVLSSDCGGDYTSLGGYFSSVGYPNNYPMNTECQWTINLAPGNKAQLSFQSFDLVTSANCNADYVEIREKNAHGKLIGIYCGNTIPSNITGTESIWIQFKSSDIGTAKGFLAEYNLEHGNELFGPSGEIASPLYPKLYEGNSFWSDTAITWRIVVDYQTVILITFRDFYSGWFMGEECFSTGLEIYDGYDDNAPLLASLCSLRVPDSIRTTSNVAFLKLHVNSYQHNIKFWLKWQQIRRPVTPNKNYLGNNITDCGSSEIIDLSSVKVYNLTSPGYPFGYARRLNCEWIFSTKPGNHLSIDFLTVDLEASTASCMLDAVKIYSKENGQSYYNLVETVCLSNSTLSPRLHTSNLMKVVFKTDAYINKTGFNAIIMDECGGSLSGPNGVIEIQVHNKSERNSFSHPTHTNCEWNITVKAGRTIEIRFLEMDIKNSDDKVCVDYIMLKNGIYPDSPLLGKGKYCGTTIPNINATTGNSLHITYTSTTFSSFKLLYKEISLACGGHIVLDNVYKSTNISSPNYPDIPPPHTECVWIISGPPGESLQIDFIDRFDLSYSEDCQKAGVELRDGGTIFSNLLGVYCLDQPSTIKTTDNILYVRFFTDVRNPKNGFSATASIASCGGIYRGKFGKLTSPSYPTPSTYPANTICTWQIIGPIDHYLTLTFNDFRFPYMRNCSNTNHLLITEKLLMGNETVLGTFCGIRSPPDLKSSSNIVTIQMIINLPQRPFKGFSITYNASQEACGGELEAESGIITSPGYPIAQHYNRNCEWRITVPDGRRITVHMLDFDLDYTQYYYNQGLAFFNAKNYRSHILYLHGNDKTDIVRSSGNHMMVYFWSLSSSNHRGFKLRYESNEPTICTGDFTKDSGVITTPTANVTTYYCQWVRKPNENTQFTNSSLTLVIDAPLIGKLTSYKCKHVTSSISVATDNEEEFIAQLCGTYTEPQIIRTPYPTTKLMITQGKYHKLMNYTISYKVNPCGGILSTSLGFISSPNFPNRYSDAIDCAWLIKIEEGQTISLNFTTMDLDTSCGNDYIDIYNGPLPSSPKIGRYCGKNNPGLILSENNALWIDYHASKVGTGKGFSLNYEPLTSGCGGIFHDRRRYIESPNYPNSYPNDAECSWEVRSDEGYHIGLSFVGRFHIEESPNCTNDFIEVFDYVYEDWVSLGRNCGRNQTNYFNSTTNRMRILFRSNSKLSASGFRAVWDLNCGGTYLATTTPKYLISPGYPIEYSPLLNCNYAIKAPGKYVNVVFEDFKLEASGGMGCKFDNVTIQRNRFTGAWFSFRYRNRTNLSYATLGVFCGTALPPPVRRSDALVITFQTDKWVNRKGFRLRYFIDSCGGEIIKEGEITSPKDITGKNSYYGSMKCIWNITAPAGQVVVVRFTFFELEHHRSCQYDSVTLYNGNKIDNNQRLAILCGNITNLPVIRSSENNLLLIMKTDVSNNLRGFAANVLFMYGDKAGCGGTVNLTGVTSDKILNSPDIDKSGIYVSNLDCQWLIVTAPDESIEITFETFHLNECTNTTENQRCTCDYLQIRDGGGPLAELISQICGHNLPTKIISSRNQLWVRMVTDGTGDSTGFRARIKRMPSICGSSVLSVTDQKQYLTSPNYPNDYPHNTRCSWTLISPQILTKMEIHFDNLEIQDSTVDGACNTDKLEIADKLLSHTITEGLGQNFIFSGPRNIPTHLGVQLPTSTFTYCGTSSPPSFYSLRNEVLVTFTSDQSISKKGFKLDYRITGCNHNYTGVQGRVLNEAGVQNCIFKISAPENYTISLYFQQFFLQSYYNTQCNPYNLQVFDGLPGNDTRIAKLCGFQLPSPIFSNTNELWFKVNNNRRGIYDFIYTTTNQGRGCGGQLFNFMGKFTSPLYPAIYRKNSVCRWDISVPFGLQASLKFLIFDLGSLSNSNTCDSNFVELIDIDPISKSETVRSTYCPGDVPSVFQASANIMALRFTTNLNNGGSGWVAVFSSKTLSST